MIAFEEIPSRAGNDGGFDGSTVVVAVIKIGRTYFTKVLQIRILTIFYLKIRMIKIEIFLQSIST